jgi:hypothetical protein
VTQQPELAGTIDAHGGGGNELGMSVRPDALASR